MRELNISINAKIEEATRQVKLKMHGVANIEEVQDILADVIKEIADRSGTDFHQFIGGIIASNLVDRILEENDELLGK